jgi:hypothetical protein
MAWNNNIKEEKVPRLNSSSPGALLFAAALQLVPAQTEQ